MVSATHLEKVDEFKYIYFSNLKYTVVHLCIKSLEHSYLSEPLNILNSQLS